MPTSIRQEVFPFAVRSVVAAGLLVVCSGAFAQTPAPGPSPTPAPSPPPVKVNEAPVLETFQVRGLIDDYYIAEGTLSDETPEKCVVYFSGALAGYAVTPGYDGSFSLSVELGPGEGGAVDAQAVDDAGNYSNVMSDFVVTE